MAPSFHIENFGCRAARADGEAVASLLRAAGLEEGPPSDADVVVVNTCSVTAEADREARAFIRRANRLDPAARIVATGCYAQRAPEELAALPGVAAVVGNSHKAFAPEIAASLAIASSITHPTASASTATAHSTAAADSATRATTSDSGIRATTSHSTIRPTTSDFSALKGHDFNRANHAAQGSGASAPEGKPAIVSIQSLLASNQPLILADDAFAHSFLEEAPVVPGTQTRPNLKIQEGCGNRCSFCVIPQTRGSSRSLPNSAILRHVQSFVSAGGNELVLSGINLGRWGRDIGQPEEPRLTLAALVRQIFNQTDLPRLRLSSIEPMDWDADLIALMAEYGGARLARHAHLPLQSGSDSVLRRMHRRYRPWHYAEKVSALLSAAGPDVTLGADVMAGFPGESEREFSETVEFIRSLPFGYLHLFPFSPRPGTRAWTLHAESPVPTPVVAERMMILRALAAEKSHAHRRSFIGAELDAITLHTPKATASSERTSALTENFLPIELAASMPANRLIRISVTGLSAEGTLFARLASSTNAYGFPLDLTAPSHAPAEPNLQTVV